MSSRVKGIRHIRVLDIRSKILRGWKLKDLENFCVTKLGVSKQTATSYIDEAAEPYRKKYQEQSNE